MVSSLNTFFGNLLVKRLRNEHLHPENPNRILGTTCSAEPDMNVPEGVRKVIDVRILYNIDGKGQVFLGYYFEFRCYYL